VAEPRPTAPVSTPRPARRIASEVTPPPPPDVATAPEPLEIAAPAPEPTPAPVEPTPRPTPAAPEETTTEIVTEAETPTEATPRAPAAPTASPRPARRPERPTQVAAPTLPTTAPRTPASSSTASSESVEAALREALEGAASQPDAAPIVAAPSGPPLTAGEKDALRVSVQTCWNVGALSSEALATTVIVALAMNRDGTPDVGTIRMLSSSGGSDTAVRQAFEAARRAIIRCGASGFPLPTEKYGQWQNIEMTFDPSGMRLR